MYALMVMHGRSVGTEAIQNGLDAAGNDSIRRKAVWVKDLQLPTSEELAQFRGGDPGTIACVLGYLQGEVEEGLRLRDVGNRLNAAQANEYLSVFGAFARATQ